MDYIRVQLDFPAERIEEINQMMRETQIGTRKELFNSALTLFNWAIQQRIEGKQIISVDDEGGRVKNLVMPALENAANKK